VSWVKMSWTRHEGFWDSLEQEIMGAGAKSVVRVGEEYKWLARWKG
jgi:hypothetical protein